MNIRVLGTRFLAAGRLPAWRIGMAALLFLGMALPLAAQTPPAEPEKKDQEKTGQRPAATEGFKWGLVEGRTEIEVGYRWVSDIAGNRDMYRSMVNLGEGPKLLRANFSLRSNYGTGVLFDRLDFSMNSWGGEPYNTMRMTFGLMDKYEFRAEYRNLNYYNFIPTYANPLIARGRLFGQHSSNVTNRMTDLELKLFPNGKIRPYIGYSRNSGFGPGFTTYAPTGNEFLLGTQWLYTADDYRGGVELSFPRLELTIEQGYRFLRNDTSVFDIGDTVGNNTRPFLGQPIVLNSLDRGLHDRTKLPVSKLLAFFTPFTNFKLTGRYVYSMADIESNFSQLATGTLASREDLVFFGTAGDTFDSRAKSPNHTGSLLMEFFPFSRLSLRNQFETRSYHVSGAAILDTLYLNSRPLSGQTTTSGETRASRLQDSLLAYDQNRNQAEFELDLGYGFTLRAGHRYTFVETALEDLEGKNRTSRATDVTQQTALAGFAFSPNRWLRLGLDYENNQADGALTRTDLLDYDQLRFNWRLNPGKKLSATGAISFVRNSNTQTDVDFSSHHRNYSFALTYEPSERCNLTLDYTRSNIYSNLAILLPQSLETDRSLFDERSHGIGGSLGMEIYRRARVDFGYRGILNFGNFPLNFHQPFADVTIPLSNRVSWKSHWQYFGYNEKGASLQDYRGHLITFSLAYSY